MTGTPDFPLPRQPPARPPSFPSAEPGDLLVKLPRADRGTEAWRFTAHGWTLARFDGDVKRRVPPIGEARLRELGIPAAGAAALELVNHRCDTLAALVDIVEVELLPGVTEETVAHLQGRLAEARYLLLKLSAHRERTDFGDASVNDYARHRRPTDG